MTSQKDAGQPAISCKAVWQVFGPEAQKTLADVLGTTVDRPEVTETTAKGAAYLAGLHLGLQPKPEDYAKSWALEKQFSPNIKDDERKRKYVGWQKSVQSLLN